MNGLLLLSACVLALALGPVLLAAGRPRPQLLGFVDGFVLVSIGGLVLLDVLPHAIHNRDVWAFVFMLAGFALPTVAERAFHYGVRQTHAVVLMLALAGLALHSMLDGSAIAKTASLSSSTLGYGVLIHQIPISMMIWWVLSDRPRLLYLVLAGMALMTIVGYQLGPSLFAILPEQAGRWFEGLVGGSLLHVIAHPAHDHDHGHGHDHAHDHAHDHGHGHEHVHGSGTKRAAWPNGVGALVGMALLVVLLGSRLEGETSGMVADAWQSFWMLTLESAPAILLAYAAAGLVHAFVPVGGLAWMSRGSRLRQGLAGMAVGLPLPVCSCGVVPLYQQLLKQGASTTAAVAFLIATPELGIDAVLLSVPLLGMEFTILRVMAAALAALGVALIMGRLITDVPHVVARADAPLTRSTRARLSQALRTGFGEMVDHTAPWILAGLFLASVVSPILRGSWLVQLPTGVDVVAFAIIGFPLYVCASASTPLVAVLVAAGVSPGAGLALLLTGPATNISTLGILTRLHGRRFALTFATSMVLCAIGFGVLVNLLFPALSASQPTLADTSASWLQVAAVIACAVLYTGSVLRMGMRGFLGELSLTQS
ncbi:MAG: hypothetical protein CK550_05305 [Gemmatimonadetes bacterium]|nr:MAG: hypothetical protein CK550_05305 [Gemmatimonadota bacterium]